MSNNCLVTKLKGVVNNNNLPELGTIIFKFRTDSTAPSMFAMGRKSGSNVYIESEAPIHLGSATGRVIESKSLISSISTDVSYNTASYCTEPDTQYEVRVTGDIYNGLWALDSQYLAKLDSFEVIGNGDYLNLGVLPDYLGLNNPYIQTLNILSGDRTLKGLKDNIKYLRAGDYSVQSHNTNIILDDDSYHNTNVLGVSKVRGNINFAPINIELIGSLHAGIHSINDFVTSRVALGRTTGSVFIRGLAVKNGNVLYNGVSTTQYILPNTTNAICFTWNGSTVTFNTETPESISNTYSIMSNAGYPLEKPQPVE